MSKSNVRDEILADAVRVHNKCGLLARDNYRSHGKFSDQEVATHFGSFAKLREIVVPQKTQDSMKPSETREFGKDSGVVATVNRNVKTLDELLAYMQVDLSVWEVEKHVINKWEVTMREPATTVGGAGNDALVVENEKGGQHTLWTRGSREPMHEPMFQVKAWLKRKQPTVRDVGFERILNRIEELTKMPKVIKYPKREVSTMLEVSLYDAHFGLLAWGRETGENYDLKIAEERYAVAINDLLNKAKGWTPEKIVIPVGNDFFHVNNPEGVTPMSKNVLDMDGRLCKIFEVGEAALINAVKTCVQVAPVQVLWIPGNHDPEVSYAMCRVLLHAFSPNKNVTVDVSPAPRKYVHFGVNLIGYTHGNEEKHGDLPTVMASEQKQIWSQVTHREWHIGHFHKKKEMRYSAGDTFGGVAVKVIPSICGTDAWHFKKGYVGGERVAEAFLYDKETGLIGTFTSKDMRSIGK